MPTPGERRALLFFATVAVLGAGWRTVRESSAITPTDEERSALERQIASVDSARTTAGRRRGRGSTANGRGSAATPTRVPQTAAFTGGTRLVDVDRASPRELETLPRIGPSLARRIVADRDSLGPFGSLEALQRVRGIGPAMAREIAPHVTFSATVSRGGEPPARGPPTRPAQGRTAQSPAPLWAGPPPDG